MSRVSPLMLRGFIWAAIFFCVLAVNVQGGDPNMVTGQDKGKSIAAPIMSRPDVVSYEFSGFIEEYLQAVSKNWLLVAPDKHPEMLDYLATRE
ncbi:MAG TPA: hypothetical protein VIJ25_14030, partial [Methylococcales bacterium]